MRPNLLSRSAIAVVLFCVVAAAQNPAASVTVDVNGGRHAIDPRVYGIAYGTTTQLQDLNVPLNRYGGNNSSRYNWQLNADNRAQDWYFESIGDTSSVAGERGDTFISTSQAGGARPMITIPMLDWVAKLGANRSKLAGFSQAKYGVQTGNDAQWFPDAGKRHSEVHKPADRGKRSERRERGEQLRNTAAVGAGDC
jgi:opacity protein-like surface antigen